MQSNAHRTGGKVALPDDEHGVDFRLFRTKHLAVDLVGGRIDRDADAVCAEFFLDPLSLGDQRFVISDGEDADLLWGEPQGEVSCVVFDEEPDEPFVRSERGAVDAQRGFVRVVAVPIGEAETFGHREIDLIGRDREFASDGAPDLDVDLGAIESGFVGDLDEMDAGFDENIPDHFLGLAPEFRLVDEFLPQFFGVMGGESHEVLFEAEDLEVFEIHLIHGDELRFELFRGAVQMGVVHLHRSDPHEAEQFTGLFVAVTGPVFGEAHWEVAVASGHGAKDLVVMRAVHRLEVILLRGRGRSVRKRIFLLEDHRGEHAFLVVRQVSAGEVHVLSCEVRCTHALITGLELGLFGQSLNFLDEDGAIRHPEGETWAHVVVEGEQFEFAAELAVVAFSGLFEHREVGFEFGLVLERGAVDALQLGVPFIALVIGGGDVGESERSDIPGAHHVRSSAEVQKIAVFEQGDLFVVGDGVEDIHLENSRAVAFVESAEAARVREG